MTLQVCAAPPAVVAPLGPLPPPLPGAQSDAALGLPEPLVPSAPSAPSDQMSLMLMLMESMGRHALEASANKIELTKGKLDEATRELTEKLQEAARKAAEAAKEDDGGGGVWGWVCDVCDAVTEYVSKVVGEVVGSVADFTVDLVMAPVDLIAVMVKGGSFTQALSQVGHNLSHDGDVARRFDGFTKGVMKFAADVTQFAASSLAVIEAGLRGENVFDAMKQQFGELRESFMQNLVKNPDVMVVTGWILKGIAVATAVGTGGTMAGVSIGLLALSELNKRYQIAEGVFGPDVGSKVTLGLELAGAGAMFWTGGGVEGLKNVFGSGKFTDALSAVKSVAACVQGAITIAVAVDNYQAAHERADELDQFADLLSLRNRIDRLQRMLEALIGEYEEKTEGHQRTLRGASDVYRTQGACLEAALFRA